MSSIRDRARITVKIHNMKRSASRAPGTDRGDSPPPRVKRIRTSMDRYDHHVPDSRQSPDRRRLRSKSVHPRYVTPARNSSHRDEFSLAVIPREPCEPPPPERGHTFKALCVSSLHPKASDEYVKETLYREFKRFGDFSVRIGREYDERVAFVCFRSSDVAREAKRQKPRIVIYDKSAMITVVYERPEQKYKPRSISPDYERSASSYYRPPVTERRRPPTIDPYNRYAHHPSIHREYRPPINHHEYMPRGPVIHHPPHIHPSHHHYVRHTIRHAPPPPHESKKDKFPNYLHHVQPEDDPQATRTLFAGNLEVNISEDELRRIFGKYGKLDDIDIKRPNPGAGNAFAFVRFENLDMANRAKIELSGQYIGKFQCKIGYGKANPTTRIWVGGLGAWTSLTQLEREFDRFGAIKKIEYKKGDNCAYIWYESIEAAQAAVKEMRGYALGGPDRRLRIDFSGVPNGQTSKPKSPAPVSVPPEPNIVYRETTHYDSYVNRGGFRGRGRGRGLYRGGYTQYEPHRIVNDEDRRRPLLALEYEPANNSRTTVTNNSIRTTPVHNNIRSIPINNTRTIRSQSRIRSPGPHTPDSEPDANISPAELLGSAVTLADVARKSVSFWTGALILKNSLFPARLHLTDGDDDLAPILMKDDDGLHNLRISQRLRMEQSKLNDVQKRIRTSKSHAIFVALPGTAPIVVHDNTVQTRPLRNLVSYLKQKQAAGVLPLLRKTAQTSGVLYAFPPCQFSSDLLRRTCHNLTDETLKEDYLVVVVIRGASVPPI
ncbi:RNA-binding protein spenito [Pseudolycoriella hygida]|uniref:RNA-binding protein spenito n=1 Tax=Pseudolycoriella hygida TaxID=35572 RepID=A0A9Q0MZK7_9DIPT|nr:RNA-binding protein spenito [Pseudolycoriella hygida]